MPQFPHSDMIGARHFPAERDALQVKKKFLKVSDVELLESSWHNCPSSLSKKGITYGPGIQADIFPPVERSQSLTSTTMGHFQVGESPNISGVKHYLRYL